MRVRRGGEEGERRGQEVGKDDCLQRFSLCWFSLPSEGLLLSGGLAQPYGFSFLLSVFFFLSQWLTILATIQAGPREDRGPKGGGSEDGPL